MEWKISRTPDSNKVWRWVSLAGDNLWTFNNRQQKIKRQLTDYGRTPNCNNNELYLRQAGLTRNPTFSYLYCVRCRGQDAASKALRTQILTLCTMPRDRKCFEHWHFNLPHFPARHQSKQKSQSKPPQARTLTMQWLRIKWHDWRCTWSLYPFTLKTFAFHPRRAFA